MQFLTQVYSNNLKEILGGAMFIETYGEMIVVKDIELFSLCEHHMLRLFWKVHVGISQTDILLARENC
mgnify:CR=1 FL=1